MDFTRQQHSVVDQLILGKSNKEIAVALGIGDQTVKAHIRNILKKAGLKSRLQLAVQLSSSSLAGLPDDIRGLGWTVAVHNDYFVQGVLHTFWIFVREGRAVKGEGRTDAYALNIVRDQIGISRRD